MPPAAAVSATNVIALLSKLGVSQDDITKLGAFVSGIPGWVKIAVPAVLFVLWLVEMVRRGGSLSPKRFFTRQPCTLFYEITFLLTYICVNRVVNGDDAGISRFFKAMFRWNAVGELIKSADSTLILPALMLVFFAAWVTAELFSGHIFSFPVRLSFKLALLACAVVVTLAGPVGLIIVTVLGLVRLITYIVFAVYALSGVTDMPKWYRKTPGWVSGTIMAVSDTVIAGYGKRHLSDGIAKRYGTESARAFFDLETRKEKLDFLDYLHYIVGDRL